MKKLSIDITLLLILCAAVINTAFTPAYAAKKHNAYGQKHYTTESAHFRIHYHRGLDRIVPRVANRLEMLRQIYAETYNISLPGKTDVVLYESDMPDAFAYSNFNFLYVGVHDYEFNLRGSSDWFDDVLTHEYAHVVSIWTGLKFPPVISEVQFGYFTHPNSASRFEGLHVFPSENMPIWFLEGIAQYESSRRGADRWDSHRDMILRTLTLSGKTLSWPHMQVFAGKGDDFEKSYNHGFSLISYIADTYGYEKIVSILRENAKVGRLSFDGSVKAVLGISAKQLYNDWQEQLKRRYNEQIKAVGKQVYGRKINKEGFDNAYPKFSPDGKKIYFLSSDENDYAFLDLYSYNLSDTVAEKKKIRYEMPVSSGYDIHNESGRIAFVSPKSRKSFQEPRLGGQRTFDLYVDELPPEKPKFFGKNMEKRVTTGKSVFTASFSPKGDKLACAVRKFDRFFLVITDTSGSDVNLVYPRVNGFASEFFRGVELPKSADTAGFSTIFSLAWSPNGKDIAVDYIDGDRRKIGIYDTLQRSFSVFGDGLEYDRRNPSFNKDGSTLYFSSDETGIFNVYRYTFKSEKMERLTNVSGGAFHPAVSEDGKRLVYTGYDRNGYGIYLIDTLKALQTSTAAAADAITARTGKALPHYSTPLSNRLKYSRTPRQMLIVPTLLAEQLVTADDDEFKGITNVKGGLVANFLDPLAWSDVGNEFGAFLLVELKRIFEFVDFDKGLISPRASYDAGVFGTSKALPVTLEGEATVRGIAGEDWFYEESEDTTMVLPYRIRLANVLFGASHPIVDGIYGRFFVGLDRYDVALDLTDAYNESVFNYNLSKGYRAGAMAWFSARGKNSRSTISPTGIAGKVQYSLWRQYSLKDENSFAVESNMLKEQYDNYLFHQIDGRLLLGMNSPIYSKHDLHISLSGSFLKTLDGNDIPSFYLPTAQVPGYAYFYKAEKPKVDTALASSNYSSDTTWVKYDTVLVTGKAVLTGQFSYRFPLWPGHIDKKLGFLYFDMLYGALNFSAGAGFSDPSEIWNRYRRDWLFSYGAEMRLEALSFNNYPLCVNFRWDYGMDKTEAETFVDNRKVTLGGHRFALNIGFDFDGWGMIPVVDYFSPPRMRSTPTLRLGGRAKSN